MDPTVITSMVAVDQAVQMANNDFPDNTPVFVGTIRGGAPNLAKFSDILVQGRRKVPSQYY